MDPFSITVGAAGLVDVCTRLGKLIWHIKEHLSSIDEELETLAQEVEKLRSICTVIRETYEAAQSDESPLSEISEKSASTIAANGLWVQVEGTLESCHAVAIKLEQMVIKIRESSSSPPSKLDALRQVIRKKLRESDLRTCRAQLVNSETTLHILLTTINYQEGRMSRKENARSFNELSRNIKSLESHFKSQVVSFRDVSASKVQSQYEVEALKTLKKLQKAVKCAAEAIGAATTNEHFHIPQTVSDIFTGREEFLQDLKKLLVPKPGRAKDNIQRRFVLHGLGGSGKTQFCCKFAQDNRDSTRERVKHTMGIIAAIVGLGQTENAVLHWLTNIDRPWLLIIDNADDASISLDDYFPKGNRGSILVTTRNPEYRVYGNVGPESFRFNGLRLDEAKHLLLKASKEPVPWDEIREDLARDISQALGFLALAIIHAGAAIRERICGLRDYLQYYEESWRRLREAQLMEQGQSPDVPIYASYEICYKKLEATKTQAAGDAVQLLNVLAFFHRNDISEEIFVRAIRNAKLEAQEEEKAATAASATPKAGTPFTHRLRAFAQTLVAPALGDSKQLLSLNMIKEESQFGRDTMPEYRIRRAFLELTRKSLVTFNEENKTYLMHPIVHHWARKRMIRRADQEFWAELAGRVLSGSILLPPLGTYDDDKYDIGVLPHVQSVQSHRESTKQLLLEVRRSKRPFQLWFTSLLPHLPDRQKLIMFAKFSLVYHKCGEWERAKPLMTEVVNVLHRSRGPEDAKSRVATMFLADIYWHLGQPDEAARLQQDVLGACRQAFGSSHPETLKVMNALGRALWQQGEYTKARGHLEKALEGMQRHLSPDHVETLDVMDNLGLTVQKFWGRHHFERAHQLHSGAVDGFTDQYGSDHFRTLMAKENLCRISVLLGEPYNSEAVGIMSEVLEIRKTKLGKNHPLTLLAMVNKAIVLSAKGHFEEAIDLIRRGLVIADDRLGKYHIGTLFGRHTLGCILAEQARYAEAEELLQHVNDGQRRMKSRRGDSYHPDRLGALIDLARCLYFQDKIDHSLAICDEAIRGFDKISVTEHPLASRLREIRLRIVAIKEGNAGPDERQSIKFPFILFRAPDDSYD